MKALVWPVVTLGCESWTLRKNEETRLDTIEMKGLRKLLRVSWTAKKTNEWLLNKAGVKRELLNTVNGSGDGGSCFNIEVWTDTAKLANMVIARFGDR